MGKGLGLGGLLWIAILISMNGSLGWIVFFSIILLGFIIIVVKEEIKCRRHSDEENSETENND